MMMDEGQPPEPIELEVRTYDKITSASVEVPLVTATEMVLEDIERETGRRMKPSEIHWEWDGLYRLHRTHVKFVYPAPTE